MRILVCRQFNLGDFIMTSAVFTALREAFPDAQIGALVAPEHADLAALHPAGLEVQTGPRRLTHAEAIAWGRRWRREKWDAILMIPENARAWSYAVWLSGSPVRIGLTNRFYRHVYNVRDPAAWSGRRHEVQLSLDLLSKGLGCRLKEHPLWLPRTLELQNEAEELTGGRRGFIAVSLGTGGTAPAWPVEEWRRLLPRLREEAEVVVLGPADHAGLLAEAADGLDVLDLTGRTSLLNLGAILARARLAVCGNTGLVHAAAAVQTPVIILETAQHDRYFAMRWGPWKSPGWHVWLKADGAMSDAEDAHDVFQGAWPMTLDQEALRRLSR